MTPANNERTAKSHTFLDHMSLLISSLIKSRTYTDKRQTGGTIIPSKTSSPTSHCGDDGSKENKKTELYLELVLRQMVQSANPKVEENKRLQRMATLLLR